MYYNHHFIDQEIESERGLCNNFLRSQLLLEQLEFKSGSDSKACDFYTVSAHWKERRD